MRLAWALLSISALLLAGCTVPQLPDESRLPIEQVILQAKCEIHDVVVRNASSHPWLLDWAASFTLTLKLRDRGGLSASSDYIGPFPIGTFKIAGNVGRTEEALRTAQFKLSMTLRETRAFNCALAPSGVRAGRSLTGELGVGEWFERTIAAMRASSVERNFNGLGHTVEFFLQETAGVTPSWAITLKNGLKTDPLFGVSGTLERTHTLDLALTKLSPAPVGLKRTERGEEFVPLPRPPGVDPDTQRRLDSILQDLQLRNLQFNR